MGRSGSNTARCNRRNRRARNGPRQRTRIHTVATGVIDNSPAPSPLVNADVCDVYPSRPAIDQDIAESLAQWKKAFSYTGFNFSNWHYEAFHELERRKRQISQVHTFLFHSSPQSG